MVKLGATVSRPNKYEEKECAECGELALIKKSGRYCSKSCARRNDKHPELALIPRRRGSEHQFWKGDDASYSAMHSRVYHARGKAREHACKCGRPAQEWANLSGDYADVTDYEAMCIPCHRAYDKGYYVS